MPISHNIQFVVVSIVHFKEILMLSVYDHQVLRLTEEFYDRYPNPPFTELETKESRQYNCLLVQSHYGYFICIPFRSRVNHKYAFHFKDSARSRRGKSALDYSKSVIVNDTVFLDSKPAIVDSDEYSEMMRNMDIIVAEILKYVDEYVSFCNNETLRISEEEFARRYRFSTLKYFHDILGVNTEMKIYSQM